MCFPPPYSPPSQQPLQQEPPPQRERVQQFIQHNPQGFVLQQQPYQPQTAGFSDISGANTTTNNIFLIKSSSKLSIINLRENRRDNQE
jgi:hypothetical protein